MILLRNTLAALSGLGSLLWLLILFTVGGGPQSLGEILLATWGGVTLGAAAITLATGRRPRAENLGAAGERTP